MSSWAILIKLFIFFLHSDPNLKRMIKRKHFKLISIDFFFNYINLAVCQCSLWKYVKLKTLIITTDTVIYSWEWSNIDIRYCDGSCWRKFNLLFTIKTLYTNFLLAKMRHISMPKYCLNIDHKKFDIMQRVDVKFLNYIAFFL